jgi:putative transposase
MPRALRLESENASYHVINRGNYRGPVFAAASTKRAFLRCLDEACQKTGWLVHAWTLMSNHFHLALTTPRPNLAAGMHWLQCTFATRFNRFRDERGHVFQGRFKSIAVEDGDPLGSVCHYIHLNPLRAHLCSTSELNSYPWTSLRWIHQPNQRPDWFDPSPALRQAGGLLDSPADRRKYSEYLGWLAENEPEQKRLRFDRMSRGWALGSADFARSLIEEDRALRAGAKRSIADMRAEYEAHWQAELLSLLRRLRRSSADLAVSGKSVEWKVALAAALKIRTTVTNQWLGENLHVGNRHEIGRKVAAWLRSPNPALARKLCLPTPHNPTP